MEKRKIKSYEELEEQLKTDVRNSNSPIAVIGGHYPINMLGQAATHPCDYGSFGIFSIKTLHLALEAIKFGKKLEKDIGLALLVDDHSQMNDNQWYMKKNYAIADKIRKRVETHFSDFQVPENYLNIMEQYGLGLDDIISSQNGKYFQESFYREQFAKQTNLDPGCSGEYRLILEELASQGIGKVIGLLPIGCKIPICNAVGKYNSDKTNPEMKTIHIYMASENWIDTPEKLLEETNNIGGILVMRE